MKDYYPFGAVMKGRSYTASGGKYRYGFNGKEYDEETEVQDYGFRMFDNGVARFFTVDPYHNQYPDLTPYQFAHNSPIENIDLDGLEKVRYDMDMKFRATAPQITVEDYSGVLLKSGEIVSYNQMDYEVVSTTPVASSVWSYYTDGSGNPHYVKFKSKGEYSVDYFEYEIGRAEIERIKKVNKGSYRNNVHSPSVVIQLNPVKAQSIVLREVQWKRTELEEKIVDKDELCLLCTYGDEQYSKLSTKIEGFLKENDEGWVEYYWNPEGDYFKNKGTKNMSSHEKGMAKNTFGNNYRKIKGPISLKLKNRIDHKEGKGCDQGGSIIRFFNWVVKNTSFVRTNNKAKKIVPKSGTPDDYNHGRKRGK